MLRGIDMSDPMSNNTPKIEQLLSDDWQERTTKERRSDNDNPLQHHAAILARHRISKTAVGKEEKQRNGGIRKNAETVGCGPANGAAYLFLIVKYKCTIF